MSIARRNRRIKQRQQAEFIEWALKKNQQVKDMIGDKLSPEDKETLDQNTRMLNGLKGEYAERINRVVIEELKNKNK